MKYLLIDSRNILYRTIFSCLSRSSKDHFATAYIRQLSGWINELKPDSVFVIWDDAKVWRSEIYNEYKKGRSGPDISEHLSSTTNILRELCKYLNIRQLFRNNMEADDLIYAAVSILHPHDTVIISSDSDLLQIPYRYNSCSLYVPSKGIVDVPGINPAMLKSLTGDKADNIRGYHGIGPKRGEALLRDYKSLNDFLEVNDRSIFVRNMLLVDLSLCPKLLHNIMYVSKQLSEDVIFDKSVVNKMIVENKLMGLMGSELLIPFRRLR